MKIYDIPTNELIPYDRNPRLNDEAAEFVAKSIEEFGFKVPIVTDKNKVVVAGHTRLKAAKMLGLPTVPVVMADDLTDDQIRAFRIADNKVAELSGWDYSKLERELDEFASHLTEYGFKDLHEEVDIDAFFAGDAEKPPEEEKPPKTVQCPHCGEWVTI